MKNTKMTKFSRWCDNHAVVTGIIGVVLLVAFGLLIMWVDYAKFHNTNNPFGPSIFSQKAHK